jgi:hypothetical protein
VVHCPLAPAPTGAVADLNDFRSQVRSIFCHPKNPLNHSLTHARNERAKARLLAAKLQAAAQTDGDTDADDDDDETTDQLRCASTESV